MSAILTILSDFVFNCTFIFLVLFVCVLFFLVWNGSFVLNGHQFELMSLKYLLPEFFWQIFVLSFHFLRFSFIHFESSLTMSKGFVCTKAFIHIDIHVNFVVRRCNDDALSCDGCHLFRLRCTDGIHNRLAVSLLYSNWNSSFSSNKKNIHIIQIR